MRKEEEQQQREQNDRKEIMELYRDMDQYNRDTWIIIGKRLLGGVNYISIMKIILFKRIWVLI